MHVDSVAWRGMVVLALGHVPQMEACPSPAPVLVGSRRPTAVGTRVAAPVLQLPVVGEEVVGRRWPWSGCIRMFELLHGGHGHVT